MNIPPPTPDDRTRDAAKDYDPDARSAAWIRRALHAEADAARSQQECDGHMKLYETMNALRLVAQADAANLRAVLRQVEWEAWSLTPMCPWCGQTQPRGHAADCVLAAALKETP